jgi:hypothetical protein
MEDVISHEKDFFLSAQLVNIFVKREKKTIINKSVKFFETALF